MKFSNSKLPKTWEELVSLKEELCCRDVDFVRFNDDELFYQYYREMIPKELRYNVLFKTIGDNDIKILRNTFPYNYIIKDIPNRIGHYCLWSRIGKIDEDTVLTEIKKTFPQKDFFWFENSPATKSIPEIWHCQIFVKED